MVPTRQGEVAAQLYRPGGRVRRAALLVPGVHSMGIAEPRLTALAQDLAGSGVAVMTMALPDLMGYQITARSADVIEDAVAWMAAQPDLAPDGRVGMVGISFAGGLSIVAAGRPSIRDKVAYVVSFGGHGDLGRVLHYLATGEAVQAPGVVTHPPHDYGVAVILYAAADRVVPPEQVGRVARRDRHVSAGVAVDAGQHGPGQRHVPEGARHGEGAARAVGDAAHLRQRPQRQGARPDPRAAPRPRGRSGRVARAGADCRPRRRCFCCTATRTSSSRRRNRSCSANYLRSKGVDVHVLLSQIITHAELDRSAAMSESWKLVAFWADVLSTISLRVTAEVTTISVGSRTPEVHRLNAHGVSAQTAFVIVVAA